MSLSLDPHYADAAPAEPKLTANEREHAVTYVRLLDAAREGADWREVARIVLPIDPDQHAERARGAYDSQLARARWLSREGYRQLLRDGWPSRSQRPIPPPRSSLGTVRTIDGT